MPNIWTHMIYGKELLKNMGRTDLLQSEQAVRVFNLGCQGPDFLFYHNFLPWNKDKRLSNMGNRIHHEHCGPFLVEMVRHACGREVTNPAVLYILGFLSHHVLDRNMHPYIFYKSGFKKWDHQRFEVILDTIMAKKFLGIETWKTPVWKEIDAGENFPPGIVELFQQVAGQFFPEDADKIKKSEWTEAYRQMIQAQKIFFDPTGLKRLLTFGQIEPMVYKKTNAPLDYLNEAHEVWNDPTSQTETYTFSVWDLWKQALADGEAVLGATLKKLEEEANQEKGKKTAKSDFMLVKAIGNKSYDTGKNCDLGLKPTYVNPIL